MRDEDFVRPSRRGFLRTTGLTALGVGCMPFPARGPVASADPDYGSYAVGIQSYCFRKFALEQALKRAAELGLRRAEIYPGHLPTTSSPEQLRAARKLFRDYDVAPVGFGVEAFTKDDAANRRVFELARALGVKYLSADPTPDSFDSLDRLVEEYRVAVAIHPHGPTGNGQLHRWYCAEVILAAVKDHHPLIGTCLDTGHLIRAAQLGKKLDPAQEVRTMGARNFALHLKDHDNRTRTDVVYGRGALDLPALLQALRDVKFKGTLSVEYEANPDDPTPDLKACLRVLKEAIRDQP
jgi:sugar phosphate isomerase/epimerase